MPKHSAHILELAKRGAEAQLRDLVLEIRELIDLFPHLRDAYDKDELPLPFIMAKAAGQRLPAPATSGPQGRRKMTAAARKAVSARMKKYWAAKRKAAAKA